MEQVPVPESVLHSAVPVYCRGAGNRHLMHSAFSETTLQARQGFYVQYSLALFMDTRGAR